MLRRAVSAAATGVYATMLGEKMRQHEVSCWLVNTGWVGGPYGVGERMKLSYTRAMLNAALSGELESVPMTPHPVFRVMVPKTAPTCLRRCWTHAVCGGIKPPTTVRQPN